MKAIEVEVRRGLGDRTVTIIDPVISTVLVGMNTGITRLDRDNKTKTIVTVDVPVDRYYKPGESIRIIHYQYGSIHGMIKSCQQVHSRTENEYIATYTLTIETIWQVYRGLTLHAET